MKVELNCVQICAFLMIDNKLSLSFIIICKYSFINSIPKLDAYVSRVWKTETINWMFTHHFSNF